MSILQWIGRKIGLLDGEAWRAFYDTGTWAGEPITPETAMQVSAFWACVRLISQTVGSLPLGIYERQADGSRKLQPDHPLYRLVHDAPNANQTAVEFWEGVLGSVCIVGNAFAEKKRNGQGQVVSLEPLCSDWMTVELTSAGAIRYRYRDPQRDERVLSQEQVFHVRGFGTGGLVGLSPIAFARQSLSSSRAAERAAASIFANGMRPSGWLLYKGGTLTPEQREQARKVLIEPMTGAANAGKTGILEADFDYRQATLSPEDSQMIETRSFSVEDVCRWLGVPPILIGHASQGQTMWGSGIEQIVIGWLTLGLRTYLIRTEQAIKRQLLRPDEQATLYPEFSVEGLLRADSTARANFYSTMAQNGIMTRNEIRSKENLPAMEGGDVLTVQVNLTPLADLGSAPADPAQQLRAAMLALMQGPDLKVIEGGRS